MQHWLTKFRNAFRGIYFGSAQQSSFLVHAIAACIVMAAATALRCESWQWCVLLLCIAIVLSLELMNSALEHFAKGVCGEENTEVGKALDIASGAVLCASVFASIVGTVILGGQLFGWFGQ